jgi:hypothetical protein
VSNGKATVEGRCTLSNNTEGLWRCKPDALAKDRSKELVDFLIGVMKLSAPITRPAVYWRLFRKSISGILLS